MDGNGAEECPITGVPPEEVVLLKIYYHHPSRQCAVSGPVGDKGLVFMLCELAKDNVSKHIDKVNAQNAVVPASIPLFDPKRFRR
jgi:hypothetical protein